MHLEIQQREKEGITILDLKGKIVLGSEDLSLRERLLSLLANGIRNVVLNLKEVTHIDTAGVGTLVLCTEKFRAAGGRLVLVNLSPAQASVASILKLDSEFDIYPDELDAVNSFFPERAVPHFDILQLVEEIKARRASEHTVESKK
jgi:anti-sigma B factor antagonist